MAETRKKSTTTTKTKTVPAKKPATKPAGKSVAPKQTKTVKAPAKTTTTKNTTVKAAKSSSASTKPAAKKKCNICKIIFAVIVAVAIVAVAVWAIACIVDKTSDKTITVENGNGDKVSMKYVSLEDYKYRVLVPADFKELSAEDIKKDYGTTEAPELVYSDNDNTVNIAFSAPNGTLADSQIKEYLDTMKTILSTGMDVISTNTYTADDDHTIGVIKLVSELEGQKIYNQMAFFSYENKLTIITFNCKDSVRAEWEKVGDEIIKSINFTK